MVKLTYNAIEHYSDELSMVVQEMLFEVID